MADDEQDKSPQGNGGGTQQQQPAPQIRNPDSGERIKTIVNRYDRNPVRIAKALDREIERLEGELKKAGVPAGAVVLQGADAAAWNRYKALGKPEEVEQKVAKVAELEGEIAKRDKAAERAKIAAGAKSAGWNPTALADFANRMGLDLELVELEVDDGKGGKAKQQVPHVVTMEGDKKDKKKLELLSTVIDRDFAIYKPALVAASEGDSSSGQGPRFPNQSPAGDGPPANKDSQDLGKALDAYLSSTYVTPGQQQKDPAKS